MDTGAGAAIGKRVTWSKQLTDKEAKEYTAENIFNTQNSSSSKAPDWFNKTEIKTFNWPQKKM